MFKFCEKNKILEFKIMVICENMDINVICQALQNVNFIEKVNEKLEMDLNIIIHEIITMNTYDVDIYDICVSCGHNITWDQEYYVSKWDIKWLKTQGKITFYETLNLFIPICDAITYNKVTYLFEKLLELFELQIE